MTRTTRVLLLLTLWTSPLAAHPGHDHGEGALAQNSPIAAKSTPTVLNTQHVKWVDRDGYRFLEADGLPDHTTGQFPNRNNPNTIRAQKYTFRIPDAPQPASRPTFVGGWVFGVALNGVPFDPLTNEFWQGNRQAGWRYEAINPQFSLGLDQHNAHVQPSGAYHYHGVPTGLIERRGSNAKEQMTLLGYAADGYPIYNAWGHSKSDDPSSPLKKLRTSYQLKPGQRPGGAAGPGGKYDGTFGEDFEYVSGSGDLDECNGRTGVTPDSKQPTYYYVVGDEFPFIPRYLRGTPDPSFQHAAARGGGGPAGRGPPPGRGPFGSPPPPGRGPFGLPPPPKQN